MTEGGGKKLRVLSCATENAFLYILWPCYKNTFSNIVVKKCRASGGIFSSKTRLNVAGEKQEKQAICFPDGCSES